MPHTPRYSFFLDYPGRKGITGNIIQVPMETVFIVCDPPVLSMTDMLYTLSDVSLKEITFVMEGGIWAEVL